MKCEIVLLLKLVIDRLIGIDSLCWWVMLSVFVVMLLLEVKIVLGGWWSVSSVLVVFVFDVKL